MADRTNQPQTQSPASSSKSEASHPDQPTAAAPPRRGSAAASIQSVLDDLFLNDGHAKRVLADNLRPRAIDAQAVRARADVAFTSFSASKYPPEVRSQSTYADSSVGLTAELVEGIVLGGISALSASTNARKLRIRETDAFTALIDSAGAPAGSIGTVALADLLAYLDTRVDMLPTERPRTVMSPCEADSLVETWLQSFEQGTENDTAPSEASSGSTGIQEGHQGISQDAQTLVGRQVGMLMAKVVAPEEQLRFEVPDRLQRAELAKALETFELRDGPSDVTSYHDFSSLQIAFQHVWTEVFDGQLASRGRELYGEYVRLKTSLGLDDTTDRKIDTLHDLAELMAEVRDLAEIETADLPPALQPATGGGSSGGMSPANVAEVIKRSTPGAMVAAATGSDATGALVDPLGWSIGKIAQWLAGKPTLTWDNFETADAPGERPLPLEGDRIQVQFESDAMPRGQVEVVIKNTDDTWWWKGIEFVKFNSDGGILGVQRVATDTDDKKGWNPSRADRLQISTTELRTAALEFLKDAPRGIGGFPTGFYRLTGLDTRIQDRMRVTFTWVKD